MTVGRRILRNALIFFFLALRIITQRLKYYYYIALSIIYCCIHKFIATFTKYISVIIAFFYSILPRELHIISIIITHLGSIEFQNYAFSKFDNTLLHANMCQLEIRNVFFFQSQTDFLLTSIYNILT